MKRLIVMVLGLSALAAPTCASAATRCRPALKQDSSLAVSGANCSLAQQLERYTESHETLDGSFFAARHQWLGAANLTGTEFVYVSPRWPTITVNITSRRPHN